MVQPDERIKIKGKLYQVTMCDRVIGPGGQLTLTLQPIQRRFTIADEEHYFPHGCRVTIENKGTELTYQVRRLKMPNDEPSRAEFIEVTE